MTVSLLIVVAAFIAAVVSAIGKCPLWVSVILLCIAALLGVLPIR